MDGFTLVRFQCTASVKNPGETIGILGDDVALGGFNKSEAKELVTDPKSYPVWKSSVLLPRNSVFQYKYLKMEYGNKFHSWESNAMLPRQIHTRGEEMTVRDVFGDISNSSSSSSSSSVATSTPFSAPINPSSPFSTSSVATVVSAPATLPSSSSTLTASTAGASNPAAVEGGAPSHATEDSSRTIPMPPSIIGRSTSVPDTTLSSTSSSSSSSSSSSHNHLHVASSQTVGSTPPPKGRLVVLCLTLPVKLHVRFSPEEGAKEIWSVEWDLDNVVAKTEDSVSDEMECVWIGSVTPGMVYVEGTPGGESFVSSPSPTPSTSTTGTTGGGSVFPPPSVVVDVFSPPPERREAITEALRAVNCVPLFVDESLHRGHYNQFCKSRLWDVFHNVLRPSANATDSSYDDYVTGNALFAKAGAAHLRSSSDIVWVHDYHLMLVPKMLRDMGKHAGPIIFFLHIPFPTSEIFRTLTQRHEILEGMLSASAIGFHTFNHGRHFLTACRRFLGADSRSIQGGTLAVDYRDRRVLITISHVGVDPKRLTNALASDTVARLLAEYEALYRRRGGGANNVTTIFASIDEMQRLKGVPLRLLAFEKLLATTPRLQNGRARFVLWTISRGSRPHDARRSITEVKLLANRINDAYPPGVVDIREFDGKFPPTLEERVALWLTADVFISTAVSEGLNLMPLEYIFCRGGLGDNNSNNNASVRTNPNPLVAARRALPGVAIVSEFSSCSAILNGAIRVNCYNIAAIAKSMDETSRMSLEERKARRSRDLDYITSPASKWTRYIINEVLGAMQDENFTTMEPNIMANLTRVVARRPLLKSNYLEAYAKAKRRVILLDFGGTLVERERENLVLKRDFLGVRGRGLSRETKATLESLCQDPRNLVFIVSGETRTVLTRVFYDLLRKKEVKLGIVAHSGLCIKYPDTIAIPAGSSSSVIINRRRTSTEEDEGGSELDGDAPSRISKTPSERDSWMLAGVSLIRGPSVSTSLRNYTSQQQPQHLARRLSGSNTAAAGATGVSTTTPNDPNNPNDNDEEYQYNNFNYDSNTYTGISLMAEKSLLEDDPAAGPTHIADLDLRHKENIAAAASLEDWKMVVPGVTDMWQKWMRLANIVGILEKYTWSTNGAVFRDTPITTTWDYTRADPEWGYNQATFLVKELEAAVLKHGLPVDVKHTKSTVQLLPRGVHKGAAATRILSTLREIRPEWESTEPDFYLCIGDDFSDELMFTAVHDYFSSISHASSSAALFTSTVGRKPTNAQFYCRDVETVHNVLKRLAEVGGAVAARHQAGSSTTAGLPPLPPSSSSSSSAAVVSPDDLKMV